MNPQQQSTQNKNAPQLLSFFNNQEIIKHDSLELFPILVNFPKPPKELFLCGEIPNYQKSIAFVGSRHATSYGIEVCNKLIAGLADYPVCIISGLAVGIDATSHHIALQYNIPTIAIPGSGLSQKYLSPRSNITLAKEILHHGGALLSPFSPETEATHWTFPYRNQLVAMLADVIVVVEAQVKSGSLSCAKWGLEYGKTVCAVPGNITNDYSSGTNYLIKQGATPITSSLDILHECGFSVDIEEVYEVETRHVASHKQIPKTPHVASLQKNLFSTLNLSEQEKRLVAKLDTPKSVNELARTLEISMNELSVHIMSLELQGVVCEEFGVVKRN